jgi:hypothetical protein
MSDSSASALEKRLNRTIARRQQLARWGKLLVLPTLVATLYVGRWNQWLALAGFALFVLEVLAVLFGEAQRCPRCEAQLVIGRGWLEEFAGTCPECGCPID